MCGFWNETLQFGRVVGPSEFVDQFVDVAETYDLRRYPILSLYNAGSFLAEEEIPFSAVEAIFQIITQRLPNLRRLVIESRAEYVERAKLQRLRDILGKTGTELGLAVGFESQNDAIRDLCVNKGCSKKTFENSIDIARSQGLHTVSYLLLKPPFLTELEAIEEAVASTRYLCNVGVNEINFETMTIEDNTLTGQLYEKGLYVLPWLWSVVEVIRRVRPFVAPFLTPMRYIAEARDIPRNCPICNEVVHKGIYERYCGDFSLAHFDSITCECQKVWLRHLEVVNPLSIPERVLNGLAILRGETVSPPIE